MEQTNSRSCCKKIKTVAHIFDRYVPGVLFDLHGELLKRGKFRSVLLVGRYIPNVQPVPLFTYNFLKIPNNEIFHRLDSVISKNMIYRKMEASFFERILRRESVSLVHAHFGMAGCNIMDVAKKLNIPLVVTFYGVDGSFCLKSAYWIPRFKRLFNIADKIIVLCDEVKNRIISLGCREDKICIWNCLEDVEFYTYSQRPLAPPVNFIIAARFVEKKGYPILLEAFAKLAKEYKDIRLTMIGYGMRSSKEKLLKMCRSLDIENRIMFIATDNNPDFPSLYKSHLSKSHIFVLPSVEAKNGDDEGGPALTLVAAQAAGLPVIATRFPGAERSVIDGKTGIYCEPNSSSVYEKMRYLYENRHLWDVLGYNASVYVRREFCISTQVEKIEAIYKEF